MEGETLCILGEQLFRATSVVASLTYGPSSSLPNAISVTDAVGNVSNFVYNASGQLVRVKRPRASANTTAVVYNSAGQVSSISNGFRLAGPTGSGPDYWNYAYTNWSA